MTPVPILSLSHRSPVLLGLEGFWNIHIVALLVLLSRVPSEGGNGLHGDYVKPAGYGDRGRSAADKSYSSDDEEMMEQVCTTL